MKPGPIFCLSPFPNIKKRYLQTLKNTWPNFLLTPFSNIKKIILTNLPENLVQFLAYHLFQKLKKAYLKI